MNILVGDGIGHGVKKNPYEQVSKLRRYSVRISRPNSVRFLFVGLDEE